MLIQVVNAEAPDYFGLRPNFKTITSNIRDVCNFLDFMGIKKHFRDLRLDSQRDPDL